MFLLRNKKNYVWIIFYTSSYQAWVFPQPKIRGNTLVLAVGVCVGISITIGTLYLLNRLLEFYHITLTGLRDLVFGDNDLIFIPRH